MVWFWKLWRFKDSFVLDTQKCIDSLAHLALAERGGPHNIRIIEPEYMMRAVNDKCAVNDKSTCMVTWLGSKGV